MHSKPPRNARGDWGFPKPDWKKRRMVLYAALCFIAGWLSFIFWKGTDTALYQQASFALICGGVALIGQYVFGAAWDDRNYMQAVAHIKRGQIPPTPESDDDTEADPAPPPKS
jgi:hypothetical protein